MVRAAEDGVNWLIWRVVVSPDIPDSLAEIKGWAFADLLHAHVALDAIEEVRDRRAEEERRRRKSSGF